MPPALTYSIATADNGTSRIGWGEETTLTADEILGNPRRSQTVGEECAAMIRDLLADGPKPANDLESELKANGFTAHAIRDARKVAKVHAVRQGFGDGGCWMWQLSPDEKADGDAVDLPPEWREP